ncbi:MULTISPECIES: hypothetical protein [unclassified Streptomyces]|uniref:hypothetical protein n=1 Tax=unclassified Streptomyces TaxID=2593676 RepID=UPI0022B69A39|nr:MULTISPECIES: hypothetical protein [unclassified Streptomyces]MCZ7416001.1 hypothetical protein [Streptomyces sp. WMMC897]MCZ7434192.1 hypothetical protein [Streptomyces sp. WMMC1477]
MPHLGTPNGPEDLRELSPAGARRLAAEIRALLVEKVSRSGGIWAPTWASSSCPSPCTGASCTATFVLDQAGVTGKRRCVAQRHVVPLSLLQLVPGLRVAAPRDVQRPVTHRAP